MNVSSLHNIAIFAGYNPNEVNGLSLPQPGGEEIEKFHQRITSATTRH